MFEPLAFVSVVDYAILLSVVVSVLLLLVVFCVISLFLYLLMHY